MPHLVSLTGLLIGSVHAAENVVGCDLCTRDMVMGNAGLLEFVVLNCMSAESPDSVNLLGVPPLGQSDCLATWIYTTLDTTTSTNSTLPDSGDCRLSYAQFVTRMSSIELQGGCEVQQGKPVWTQPCIARFESAMETFIDFSEVSIAYPQCESGDVRDEYLQGRSASVLTRAADPSILTPGMDPSFPGLCYQCYSQFFNTLQTEFLTFGDVEAACLISPSDPNCYLSTPVQNARTDFKKCAGVDIRFSDPSCTSSQVNQIQSFIPSPYFTLSHCVFHPSAPFCKTVDSYFEKIARDSSASCAECYTRYQVDVEAEATRARGACTGSAVGIWAEDCVSALTLPLLNFGICAGVFLTTEQPDVVVPLMGGVATTSPAPLQEPVETETTKDSAPGLGISHAVLITYMLIR
jgi:hypothetical protein